MDNARPWRVAVACCLGLGAVALSSGQVAAQTASPLRSDATAGDVVVTAQRIGIPVWRVTSPRATIVLVGSIGRVAPGTRWDPTALDAALAQADRIMFPEAMDVSFGLFSVIGLIGKWRAQASLPKGQTLQTMTTPDQWARLVALRDRGILKPGFERVHPYHLAMRLGRSTRDGRKFETGADGYVRRYLRKHGGKEVPLARGNLKGLTAEFFASSPREHVACMMDAVTLVEAGQAGVRARATARDARSTAWAARRVPDALKDKAADAQRSCWPRGSRMERMRDASLSPAIRSLLTGPQVTLAVVSLDSLAKPGGVLDDLVAEGFDVRGPRWKR